MCMRTRHCCARPSISPCAPPPTAPTTVHTAQASATPRVRESIIACLGLQRPALIAASFNRPNIALRVRHKVLLGASGSDDDVVEVRAREGGLTWRWCWWW